jgi:WD40 repeat protein
VAPSPDLGDRAVSALALSRNDLAVGLIDGGLSLWSLKGEISFEPSRTLMVHELEITRLAFSWDGRWLASADRGGQLLLWDLARGGNPVRLAKAVKAEALAFREDGSELLVADGSSGGTVDAFTLDLSRLEALACRAAGRDLSPSEAREFLGEDDPPRVCPDLPRGVDSGI